MIVCEINYWNPVDLGNRDPRIDLQIQDDNGNHRPPVSLDWDDDLNAGLIELQVKAADSAQEGDRFSYGLEAAFHKAVTEFGNGFFNAVLIGYVQESEFGQNRFHPCGSRSGRHSRD